MRAVLISALVSLVVVLACVSERSMRPQQPALNEAPVRGRFATPPPDDELPAVIAKAAGWESAAPLDLSKVLEACEAIGYETLILRRCDGYIATIGIDGQLWTQHADDPETAIARALAQIESP